MPTLVTRAQLSDALRVSHLFDAYRQFYRQLPDEEGALAFVTERITGNESVIFLATESDSGAAVGFTQLYPLYSSVRMSRVWVLNDLFVAPSTRRAGVGEQLILTATDFARSDGAGSMQLETAVDNYVAQSLYERLGWQKSEGTSYYTFALQ